MLLSFALVASAEGTTTPYTITIENTTSGYAYAAYQIFSGDVATLNEGTENAKTVLTNINWGTGVDTSDDGFQTAVLKAIGVTNLGEGETFTAEYVASKLTDTNAAAFAKAVGDYLVANAAIAFTDNTATITKNYTASVTGGYYLIENTGIPTDGVYTAYILKVAGNVTAKPKTGVPTIEKKVYDVNDTTTSKSKPGTSNYVDLVSDVWVDSADHDIGDTVWFKVTVTIPADTLNRFDTYQLTITDTLSKGLTYNEGSSDFSKLNHDNKNTGDYSSFFKVDAAKTETGTRLTVKVDREDENLKAVIKNSNYKFDFSKELVFCWAYSCTLNSDAVIGAAGNPNDVVLTYSNNPNDSGTGTTPKDTAIVFTYQVDVNKVDEKNEPLKGANFTLYKQVTADTSGANTGTTIKAGLDSKVKAAALVDTNSYVVVANKTGDANGSTFNFKGIDDGTYVLVETTIPDGYNAWESQTFTVNATHTNDGDTSPLKLTDLSGGDLFTGTVSTGILSATIENKAGNTLPSTGGMGTTIFYLFGSVLVLGAGILLIAKKRVSC